MSTVLIGPRPGVLSTGVWQFRDGPVPQHERRTAVAECSRNLVEADPANKDAHEWFSARIAPGFAILEPIGFQQEDSVPRPSQNR
jgi:hypothetical protein